MVSQLASKFAFFPPSPPTYQLKKRDDGKLTVVSTAAPIPHADDTNLDVLLVDTKHGNKIVAFYLRNPYARLTLLYSHGNAADLGQLYDLFVQLKVNLRVNLMGLVVFYYCSCIMIIIIIMFKKEKQKKVLRFFFIFCFSFWLLLMECVTCFCLCPFLIFSLHSSSRSSKNTRYSLTPSFVLSLACVM